MKIELHTIETIKDGDIYEIQTVDNGDIYSIEQQFTVWEGFGFVMLLMLLVTIGFVAGRLY